ncbi:Ni/Fe hydrogenase [Parasulfuritortus cantonensis]|uniref:hydrogenase (acceptor) n=1 Tax=Parasulfuritortus cantonensis TaxID=2528202 RepID=A0A4R1B7V0_9PROT|nr:hydrogenase small subunit [Parasulfuritortus cantonensis]TCJ11849.1 Ni/Fe hydrogenase [Parasulfuritortus cantonensis]
MRANRILDTLAGQGITRRAFLKYCATLASLMALPPSAGKAFADALAKAPRPSVIWLPFQECTGCTEAITRSHSPSIEGMLFDMISLDYQETLMAAAGHQAEAALHEAIQRNMGKYLLIVDGSVPLGLDGAYSCIAGRSNLETLKEVAAGAAAIVAMGSCAAYGGLPKANPNPTGAVAVSDVIKDKPIINIPGCPPIPVVMTGVLAHFLTFGGLPELDRLGRPKAFYGETIHDRCYRRPFYDQGKFAKTFDDEGARKGWCLFELGCKGPVTYNACASVKWNDGTSWPVESGHGCLGCSEPDFWDAGGFYKALSMPARPLKLEPAAIAAGVVAGAAIAASSRSRKSAAKAAHETTTLADLEK